MKIFYLAQSSIPSRTANSMHVMKMAQAFVQSGHDFKLLARHADSDHGEFEASLDSLYGLNHKIELHLFHPIPGLREYGIALKQAIYASRSKPELVITRDIPTAAACLLFRIATVLELHSPEMGPLKSQLFKWLIRCGMFSGLVVINQALRSEMALRHPSLSESQILVAPDAVDLERFTELPAPSDARRGLGLPDAFTAGYAGHLYQGRGIELIMEMATKLPEVQFLIVGGNPQDVVRCKEVIRIKNIKNMIFKGFVPNSDVPIYLAASDVLLMPYQESVSVSGGGNTVRWMSPMKVFEYMAARRPIFASDLPALREILNHQNSVLLPSYYSSQWVSKLRSMFSKKDSFTEFADSSRRDVMAYSWNLRVDKILKFAQK